MPQKGTRSVARPATVKPILLTRRGDMRGNFVIHPDANRDAVLLKPKTENEFFQSIQSFHLPIIDNR